MDQEEINFLASILIFVLGLASLMFIVSFVGLGVRWNSDTDFNGFLLMTSTSVMIMTIVMIQSEMLRKKKEENISWSDCVYSKRRVN